MNLIRLLSQKDPLFPQAFRLYEVAFPALERRDLPQLLQILENPDYHMDVLLENGTFVGILFYWDPGNLIFLEHFAICPQLRNLGYGAQALSLLKKPGKPILLEIEPPVDNLTCRRQNFYMRNGFLPNAYHHIQAKYRPNDEDLVLKILSFPRKITQPEYDAFYRYMQTYISCKY